VPDLVVTLDIQRTDQKFQRNFLEGLDNESKIQLLSAVLKELGDVIDGTVEILGRRNCVEAKTSGIYDIALPNFGTQNFQVACDAETQGGGWTVILRRMDGSENFYRNWADYKEGFGDLDGEFFMGLDKIHAMTSERKQELLVILEDHRGTTVFENYNEFAIGNEDQQYVLHTLGKASGNAGDSLEDHRGMKFSTWDRDNGMWPDNCAQRGTGAWWYKNCQWRYEKNFACF